MVRISLIHSLLNVLLNLSLGYSHIYRQENRVRSWREKTLNWKCNQLMTHMSYLLVHTMPRFIQLLSIREIGLFQYCNAILSCQHLSLVCLPKHWFRQEKVIIVTWSHEFLGHGAVTIISLSFNYNLIANKLLKYKVMKCIIGILLVIYSSYNLKGAALDVLYSTEEL